MNAQPDIVVGCDGTPDSDPALRFAIDETLRRAGRLVIVIAYQRPIDPDLDSFDTPGSELEAHARDRAQAAIRRVLTDHDPQFDQQVVAVEGEPAQVLLDQADHAALIIVGDHERSLLARLFDRDTARQLLHANSVVPVTVVPGPDQS